MTTTTNLSGYPKPRRCEFCGEMFTPKNSKAHHAKTCDKPECKHMRYLKKITLSYASNGAGPSKNAKRKAGLLNRVKSIRRPCVECGMEAYPNYWRCHTCAKRRASEMAWPDMPYYMNG